MDIVQSSYHKWQDKRILLFKTCILHIIIKLNLYDWNKILLLKDVCMDRYIILLGFDVLC